VRNIKPIGSHHETGERANAMAEEANKNNNNNAAGDGANNAAANNNANANAGGSDNNDKGNGGDGKTIPVESYNIIRDKYQEAKTKLEKIAADKEAADKKRLEEQGQFKELADKEKKRADDIQARFENNAKTNAVKLAAMQAGTVDAEAVEKLVNLADVKMSEDGIIDNDSVKKLVEGLKTAKPYLFGKQQNGNQNVGANGGAPNGENNGDIKTFKRSQLRNAAFYKANEKDILAAAAAGKIENDL